MFEYLSIQVLNHSNIANNKIFMYSNIIDTCKNLNATIIGIFVYSKDIIIIIDEYSNITIVASRLIGPHGTELPNG